MCYGGQWNIACSTVIRGDWQSCNLQWQWCSQNMPFKLHAIANIWLKFTFFFRFIFQHWKLFTMYFLVEKVTIWLYITNLFIIITNAIIIMTLFGHCECDKYSINLIWSHQQYMEMSINTYLTKMLQFAWI